MPGQLIQRGENVWLARVYMGKDPRTGKRVYANKTIHGNKKDAQKYLTGAVRDRDLGVYAADPKGTTVGVLLDALLKNYKTNEQSVEWCDDVIRCHLRPFFGHMKAQQVGTDQIDAFIEHRRKPTTRTMRNGRQRQVPPAANATINRELALLRRAFNLGLEAKPQEVTSVPPIPKLKEAAPRKGFFEDDAFLAVRRLLPEEIRGPLTFAYYSGCRKGEILGLRWEQVDFFEKVVRLDPGETKNDEPRTLPLVPELLEMLRLLREVRDRHFPECPWVFFRAGEQIKDFKGAWATACKAAGLVDANGDHDKLFHDLRRTGVRNLAGVYCGRWEQGDKALCCEEVTCSSRYYPRWVICN